MLYRQSGLDFSDLKYSWDSNWVNNIGDEDKMVLPNDNQTPKSRTNTYLCNMHY